MWRMNLGLDLGRCIRSLQHKLLTQTRDQNQDSESCLESCVDATVVSLIASCAMTMQWTSAPHTSAAGLPEAASRLKSGIVVDTGFQRLLRLNDMSL